MRTTKTKLEGEHSIRALTISIEQIHLWYRQSWDHCYHYQAQRSHEQPQSAVLWTPQTGPHYTGPRSLHWPLVEACQLRNIAEWEIYNQFYSVNIQSKRFCQFYLFLVLSSLLDADRLQDERQFTIKNSSHDFYKYQCFFPGITSSVLVVILGCIFLLPIITYWVACYWSWG